MPFLGLELTLKFYLFVEPRSRQLKLGAVYLDAWRLLGGTRNRWKRKWLVAGGGGCGWWVLVLLTTVEQVLSTKVEY